MDKLDAASGGRRTQRELDADQRELLADQRELLADQREAALKERENRVRVHEDLSAHRRIKAQAILDDADQRDGEADARDATADNRDQAESLHSFLNDENFTPGVRSRGAARMDRTDSAGDRLSAADDRFQLTDERQPNSDAEASGTAGTAGARS